MMRKLVYNNLFKYSLRIFLTISFSTLAVFPKDNVTDQMFTNGIIGCWCSTNDKDIFSNSNSHLQFFDSTFIFWFIGEIDSLILVPIDTSVQLKQKYYERFKFEILTKSELIRNDTSRIKKLADSLYLKNINNVGNINISTSYGQYYLREDTLFFKLTEGYSGAGTAFKKTKYIKTDWGIDFPYPKNNENIFNDFSWNYVILKSCKQQKGKCFKINHEHYIKVSNDPNYYSD